MQETPRKGQRQLQQEDAPKRSQHGRDQIARDMGRGGSDDHGRDQTAREMSEDPKPAERRRK